jgi:hypothetical protein
MKTLQRTHEDGAGNFLSVFMPSWFSLETFRLNLDEPPTSSVMLAANEQRVTAFAEDVAQTPIPTVFIFVRRTLNPEF